MKHLFLSLAVLACGLVPCVASATLGEPESSVQTDRQAMHGSIKTQEGSVKVQERAGYRVHEIQLPSKTVLREFVGADGKVFAVAWQGPFMPNLRQTLGRYFDSYSSGGAQRHASRRHMEIRQADLVVQSSGHMRAFSGRAYLPQELPAGVVVGDLR